MDDILYSEGAGPATIAVMATGFLAATAAALVWFRSSLPEAAVPASGAFSTVVAILAGLAIGFGALETLVRRRVVLTRSSLRVGRELISLQSLSAPVLAGDRVSESVRNAAQTAHSMPSGCRALGGLHRAVLGQGVVTVVGSEPREVLVIYTWRPAALAHFLRRALERDGDSYDGWE